MKNTFLLLALSILTFTVKAQPAPEKIQKDGLQIGRASTLLPKELIFDSGDGVSNKKLSLDPNDNEFDLNSSLNIQGNLDVTGTANIDGATILQDSLSVESISTHKDGLIIGEGVNADKAITLDKGGSNPYLKWDSVKQKWVFSNDSVIEKAIGSGAGGAGAISVLENGGFEDGINSGWEYTSGTVTALTPPNALYQEASAQFDPAAQNDYLRSVFFTVPKILRGQACEMRFFYTGGDALNYSAKVETESGVILGTFKSQAGANVLPVHTSLGGYESVFFKCPTETDVTTLSTNGNIRLVIYQGTATNATAMVVDDVHLGGLIGLVETTTPDFFSAYVNSLGVVSSENVDWINGNAAVTDTSFYTLTFNSGIFSNAPVCVTRESVTDRATGIAQIHTSFPNYASIRTGYSVNTSTMANNPYAFHIICSRSGSDAKQSVQVYKSIPKVVENSNSFSAVFTTGGAVLLTSHNSWITSASISDTSLFTANFPAGTFSETPICNAGIGDTDNTSSATVKVTSLTPTEIKWRTLYGSTKTPLSIHLTCTKSGTDNKMPTVQPIIIGQVTNSVAESSLVNMRIESCQVNNSGAVSLDSSKPDCANWISSATRYGMGQVSLAIKPNIFSRAANCTAQTIYNTMGGGGGSGSIVFANTSNFLTNIDTRGATNSDSSFADVWFHLICIGAR